MILSLAPTFGVAWQGFTHGGLPLAGGLLYTYTANSTTPLTVYQDEGGNTAHTNPIVLDSSGRIPGTGEIWVTYQQGMRWVLNDSLGNLIQSFDNIQQNNFSFDSSTGLILINCPQSTTYKVAIATENQSSIDLTSFGPTIVGFEGSTTVSSFTGSGYLLKFTTQPSNQSPNASFSVVVTIQNLNGSTATGFTGNITIGLGKNYPASTLSGTLTQALVSGVATFSGLSISTIGDFTIVATAPNSNCFITESTEFFVINNTYNNVPVIIFDTHASPMTQVFTGMGFGMCGYDDSVIVATDATNPGTIYRIHTDGTSPVTQVTGLTGAGYYGVDENGNVYLANATLPFPVYRIRPDATLEYFNGAGALWDYPIGVPINAGLPNQYIIGGGQLRDVSSINWTTHAGTITSISGGSSGGNPAKQYANVAGSRVYCSKTGGFGYTDLASNTYVSLGTLSGIDVTCMLCDGDANIYVTNGTTVYRYDNTGSLLGSVAPSGASGTLKLACVMDTLDRAVWCYQTGSGTKFWKIRRSDMTVVASGTIAQQGGQNWAMAIGTRLLDQTSPILFLDGTSTLKYLGKLVTM